MVRRSRVVILDEASASVDFETDSLIQQTIRTEIAANSTVLTIAHRLKTIADYDRIIVMDKGRIVEFDKPATLLATEGSIFRDMCQASGEFELLVQIANGTAKL
ncbi:hypothetical protein GQ42DRAFT_152494 [Ramicandelaber brevisporus]|nr:hypothetical protein GQ42DRAFT_152494 [Ramicandelaber brevisporus]